MLVNFLSYHVTSCGIVDRYIQHDVNAVVVVEETAEQLAVMVVNICRIIDPVLLRICIFCNFGFVILNFLFIFANPGCDYIWWRHV